MRYGKTFDEIQIAYGKISLLRTMQNLSSLGNQLFGNDKWSFADSFDSNIIVSGSGQSFHVSIGINALTDNCEGNECNKSGYVLDVKDMKDMNHENQHVYQHTKAWNDTRPFNSIISFRRMTDTVRRIFVGGYLPSVYYNCCSNDPSETAAEWHGMRQTLNYFDSDPIVTKTEAENILYDLMMSEDCIHKEMLDPYRDKLKTIYDVLDLFEERMKTCADIKYDVTMDINPRIKGDSEVDLTTTDKFLHDDAFKEYRNMLNTCKTGVEQDMVLEQFLIVAHPDIIRKAPLRLREEMLECRKHMELDTWRPGLHPVHPKRLNLSVGQVSEMGELQLTDDDLATIPEDLQLTDEDLTTIPVDGDSLNL